MIAAAAAAPVTREQFTVSPSLMQVRDLIYKTAGIFQSNNRLRFLDDQCQKRMQALGLRTMREYFDCLTNKPIARGELSSLQNEITIGETFSFRNQPQLEGIRNVVLPRVMEARSTALKSPWKRSRLPHSTICLRKISAATPPRFNCAMN
jgi:hypothetical protein